MINANKPYIFAWFSIWIILAQTSVTFKGIHAIPLKSEDNDGGHGVISASNSENSEHPSLSCVIFQAKGCLVECTMKGVVFFQNVLGECSKNNFCQCTMIDDTSYETLWTDKFGHESDDIREEIRKNDEQYEKVLAVLEKPFRTGSQTKSELKPFLTESQYSRLEVDDNTPAAWMLRDNVLDTKFMRQFIGVVLPYLLRTYRKFLAHVKYDSQLLEAFDHYQDEHFQSLASDIRRTENNALIQILDQYLNKTNRSMKKEAVREDDDINMSEILKYRIIDDMIKVIDSTRNGINGDRIPESSEDEDD